METESLEAERDQRDRATRRALPAALSCIILPDDLSSDPDDFDVRASDLRPAHHPLEQLEEQRTSEGVS